MKKNDIKKLAFASFKNNKLDDKVVFKISSILKREDLKLYIKDLRNMNSKKIVTVTLPSIEGTIEIEKHFSNLYKNKKIIVKIDPSLLSGIRVVDYDNVYELSLKNILSHSLKGTRND